MWFTCDAQPVCVVQVCCTALCVVHVCCKPCVWYMCLRERRKGLNHLSRISGPLTILGGRDLSARASSLAISVLPHPAPSQCQLTCVSRHPTLCLSRQVPFCTLLPPMADPVIYECVSWHQLLCYKCISRLPCYKCVSQHPTLSQCRQLPCRALTRALISPAVAAP